MNPRDSRWGCRHHGNRADAVVAELATVADDAIEHRLDVGTVVADEHHYEALRAARRVEGMALAVDPEKIERVRLHAKILACRASMSTRRCAPGRASCCPTIARTTRCTFCAFAPATRSRCSTGAAASLPHASRPSSA